MSPEQLRAATSDKERCYVKAGPGAGKTYLATEAFGYLRHVRHQGDQRGVIGITFARSARQELERRIRARWGERASAWPNGIVTFDEIHRRILRHLVAGGHIDWPGGQFPLSVHDSWDQHGGATRRPGKKTRRALTLDPGGTLVVESTSDAHKAPTPCFTDTHDFLQALGSGACTHTDIRNVLRAALDHSQYPAFSDAVRGALGSSICHVVIDEAFDMNQLDIVVVERALEAGLPVTIVGDPWQSLYEFRGSSPKRVERLLNDHGFLPSIDMPGSRRYKTTEMQELAHALFFEQPFAVTELSDGDEFDVVLAHDWNTLWEEQRVPVLPAGKIPRMDGSALAACFVLLLNEVVQDCFGMEATGVAEARRRLGEGPHRERLSTALSILRDPSRQAEDVWTELKSEYAEQLQSAGAPKGLARQSMVKLKRLAEGQSAPLLGLTVHQAKGLEWDRVLVLCGELATQPGWANRLDIEDSHHRGVYVALTRAREKVRVAHVADQRFGRTRSRAEYVRAT